MFPSLLDLVKSVAESVYHNLAVEFLILLITAVLFCVHQAGRIGAANEVANEAPQGHFAHPQVPVMDVEHHHNGPGMHPILAMNVLLGTPSVGMMLVAFARDATPAGVVFLITIVSLQFSYYVHTALVTHHPPPVARLLGTLVAWLFVAIGIYAFIWAAWNLATLDQPIELVIPILGKPTHPLPIAPRHPQ